MAKIVILDPGKRWWPERILAAVFYACTVYFLYLFFANVTAEFTEQYYKTVIKSSICFNFYASVLVFIIHIL